MNRRESFLWGAVLVMSAVAAVTAPALYEIHRYDRAADRWERCRMYDLCVGDCYRLGDLGTFTVDSPPTKGTDGVWGVQSAYRLDPTTNQWVAA